MRVVITTQCDTADTESVERVIANIKSRMTPEELKAGVIQVSRSGEVEARFEAAGSHVVDINSMEGLDVKVGESGKAEPSDERLKLIVERFQTIVKAYYEDCEYDLSASIDAAAEDIAGMALGGVASIPSVGEALNAVKENKPLPKQAAKVEDLKEGLKKATELGVHIDMGEVIKQARNNIDDTPKLNIRSYIDKILFDEYTKAAKAAKAAVQGNKPLSFINNDPIITEAMGDGKLFDLVQDLTRHCKLRNYPENMLFGGVAFDGKAYAQTKYSQGIEEGRAEAFARMKELLKDY